MGGTVSSLEFPDLAIAVTDVFAEQAARGGLQQGNKIEAQPVLLSRTNGICGKSIG